MNYNYENIIIFALIIIIFSIIITVYGDSLDEDVYAMMFTLPVGVTVIMAFSLSKKYKTVPKFCLSHFVLGISMTFWALAELSWILFAHWNLDQYPSLVDGFYSVYFLFAILHPISILRFFEVKVKKVHYLIVIGTIASVIGAYVLFTPPLDGIITWIVGIHFIGMSSTLLGVTIVTTILLRKHKVFEFWILLAIAFTINCLGDLYYYSSENWSDWKISDPVNIIWFTSVVIIVYALLQHRRMYHALSS